MKCLVQWCAARLRSGTHLRLCDVASAHPFGLLGVSAPYSSLFGAGSKRLSSTALPLNEDTPRVYLKREPNAST